jgi:hypothetical protein
VYTSWQSATPSITPPPEAVYSMPGFVSAMFQVQIQVPASIQNLNVVSVANGVERALLGLQFSVPIEDRGHVDSNVVCVYLKQ